MTNLTLCILAAGVGSRYGWLKQIDGFGPHNEAIIEYSIYDAIKAWFTKVVIVIKKDIEEIFKNKFRDTFLDKIQIEFAYQDLDVSQYEYQTPSDRVKPRWTAHAVMTAAPYIDWPFVVISADDYYGPGMMNLITDNMNHIPDHGGFIVCYCLKNTLSDFWWVNRGACQIEDGKLVSIQEHLKITRNPIDHILRDQDGIVLDENTPVTMLSYCFQKDFLDTATQMFQQFLDNKPGLTDEFFLPVVVDYMMKQQGATFEVLMSQDQRAGVSNPDDKALVQKHLSTLVSQGVYPDHLWS